MKNYLFLYLLVFTLSFFSCQNSKHFTKLGQKQEAAGLTNEAAESFYTAVMKKRSNLDAQIGLKKNGQLVLNLKLNEFTQRNSFGTLREAVYAYQTALDYKNKIAGVGVELTIPDYQIADFEKAKKKYLEQVYEDGTKLLEESKFKEAETQFSEISKWDPNFKDAENLKDIAYCEPLYQKGLEEFNAKRYRASHTNLEQVHNKKLNYKETEKYMEMCIQKGTYTMALMPFQNGTNINGVDTKAGAYILNALTGIKDPFLNVVDRENLQTILNEQKFQMSGVFSESTAVEIGKIAGAKAIITGTVLNHTVSTGQLRKVTRNGFESYQVQKTNAEGKTYYDTQYKAVTYDEYYNYCESNVSIQYKLTSLETGGLLKTEIITDKKKDEVLYVVYGGNANNLYPANGNVVNTNYSDRQALKNMLNGRKNLADSQELANSIYIESATKIANNLAKEMLNLVK
jgi:Curli production assembly/transport component CsgG